MYDTEGYKNRLRCVCKFKVGLGKDLSQKRLALWRKYRSLAFHKPLEIEFTGMLDRICFLFKLNSDIIIEISEIRMDKRRKKSINFLSYCCKSVTES